MFLNRKRKGPPGHLTGNPNDPGNLVLLTPREHFICHVLFYKMMKDTKYEHQAGSALQFFFTKVITKHPRTQENVMKDSRWYEKCRLIGLQSISTSRKGTMPVKDAITGTMIGSVSIIHPKVLSGEWVHHTKGRIQSEEERMAKASHGEKNGRFSGITDEQILDVAIEVCKKIGYFQKKEFEKRCKELKYPTITYRPGQYRFKEDGGGIPGLLNRLSKILGDEIGISMREMQKRKIRNIND